MKRAHRKAHLIMWLILGPLVLFGLVLGIASRRDMPVQPAPMVDKPLHTSAPATEAPDP